MWEKWKDPLLSNYKETEWPGFDLDANDNQIPIHTVDRQPVLHTPFGMVSMVNDTMAANNFDFWIMHTNFDLTEGLISMIEQTPGVETLEIYTRYRGRIGFPMSELFNTGLIINSIDKIIHDLNYNQQNMLLEGLDDSIFENAVNTRDIIDNKFAHWAMWVVPSGNLEILGADKLDEQYRKKLKIMQQAQISVGGCILTSENEC